MNEAASNVARYGFAERQRRIPTSAFVCLILLTVLCSRLIVASFIDVTVQGGDAPYYFGIARNLLRFGVHGTGLEPQYFRVPLYPALLALIGMLPGDWVRNTIIIQSGISALTAVAVFILSRRLRSPYAQAWPLLIAASPFAAFWDFKCYAESLYTNLLLLTIAASLGFTHLPASARTNRPGNYVRFALIGVGLGLLALTRETFILLPIAFALGAMVLRLRIRGSFLLTSCAVAVLVVVPWMARNAVLPGGGFFLSRGTLGLNLWVGTWERDMQWSLDDRFPDYAFTSSADRQRVQRATASWDDPFLRRRAIERIEAHPAGIVAIWLRRAPQTWIGTRSEANAFFMQRGSLRWKAVKATLFLLNAVLLVSGLAGIAIAARRDRRYLLPAIPITYLVITSLPFHSVETRYSTAVLPFFWLYAAVTWTTAWLTISRSRRPVLDTPNPTDNRPANPGDADG